MRAALILASVLTLTPATMPATGLPFVPHAGAALAQSAAPEAFAPEKEARMLEALRLRDIMEVIAAEGLQNGPEIAADMFPGRAGGGWVLELERIYNVERLMGIMQDDIAGRISEEHADTLITFFESPLGMRIIEGEVAARQAMLDPAVDDAAHDLAIEMRVEGGARVDQITAFIEVYDLITANVVGGLNSNYAFYQGLVAGGALPETMTEDQIVNEVWSQQDTIRADTTDWLYAYLIAAYSGLTDDEFQTYIAFAETDAAKAFNGALFESFGKVFETVSRNLGRAVADRMLAQDI